MTNFELIHLWERFPTLKSYLLIMKLSFILFFLGMLQVSASVYSQSKLTYSFENKSIKNVLEEIENTTELRFFYNEDFLDMEKQITIAGVDVDINDFLASLLETSDAGFRFLDNNLVVIVPIEAGQQQGKVTGTVTDKNGAPLPGVNIVVTGTTRGTLTDVSGKYSLDIPQGSKSLTFTFIGMQLQEINIGTLTQINVKMAELATALEEVVVIGYGTVRKSDLTGSVSSVKAKDMSLVNAVNVNNLLQGKVPGLNIISSTAQPGGNININIRGALSPNGSNAPLYVIDGVPILDNSRTDNFAYGSSGLTGSINRNPLNSINPNDIESVDVLKDASASAIYGTAAANGVILITTKQGKQGKTNVSYSGSYSIQTRKEYLEPLNATDFMTYHNLFMEENHKFVNKIAPYGNTNPATKPFTPFFTTDQIANAGEGTDWMDYIMRQGEINDQNISISGGTDKTKYFSSFNYFDQKALLKNSNMTRFSGRMNLDQKIGSKVNVKIGVSYSQIDNDNVATGQAHNDEPNMLQSALRFAPNFGVYDENGNLTTSYLVRTPNPQSFLMVKNNTITKRLLFTPSMDINLMEGLKLSFVGGYDESSSKNDMYVPVGAKFQTAPNGNAQIAYSQVDNIMGESYLTFKKNFGANSVLVVGGLGYYSSWSIWDGVNAEGFLTDAFSSYNMGIASLKDKFTLWSGKNEQAKLSQFLRVNYSFMDKYILTFNGRHDGSSIWAEDKKWGFFPGFSFAWVMTKESFLDDVSFLNSLKLRAGYGTVGNEGLGGNYSISLYGTANNAWRYAFGNPGIATVGILQSQLGNPNLTWETDVTVNAGIDFELFDGRIAGSSDYFQRTANDLFDWQTLPSANGIGRIGANIGSTRSSGFEFAIKSVNIRTNSFNWTSDITFSTNKSYWVERNPAVALAKYIGENDPIRAVYGWKTNGLIRSTDDIPVAQSGSFVGNLKYIDLNEDGKLNIDDVTYLGTSTPKGFFGFGNTLTYKDFDLNVFIYGNYGGLQWDQYLNFTGLTGAVGLAQPNPANAEKTVKDVWASFNPEATYPGIAPNPVNSNNPSGINNFGMYEMYFARVKNIAFGYNLPADLIQKLKVFESIRVFMDLQNFFVLTNDKGLDPEMERNNFPYPVARTTTFGLNVNF